MPGGRDLESPRRVEQLFEVIRRLLATPKTVAASTTLLATHTTVLVDATGGAVTITLPPVSQHPSRVYTIKKVDVSANAVTVTANAAETIDGSNTYSLATQWKSVTVISDGTQWYTTAKV